MWRRRPVRSFVVVAAATRIQRSTMFSSNTYAIRPATEDDAPALRRLAALDSCPPLGRPGLIAEIDGTPAAALSLADGRLAADPFLPTAPLAVHLRLRAEGVLAHDRESSLAARIRAALPPLPARRAQTA
jgi:hypothetical protein